MVKEEVLCPKHCFPFDTATVRYHSRFHPIKQIEYSNMGAIILLTRPENNEMAKRAAVLPVNSVDEALEEAHEKCGTDTPKVTVMPQGANTLPIYNK